MKKNRTMRVAVLMLALTLLTCCFVGSTFAKYTSSATGSDSVKVAKWAFEVGADNDIAGTTVKDFTFNLFDTILDTKDNGEGDYTETDVYAESGKVVRVAPGTKGSFTIDLSNASEVTARYKADFVIENAPTNLKFSVNGGEYADTISVDWTTIAIGADAEIVVAWEWAFETTDGDATDTTEGIAAETVEVTATISVEQVD